MKEKVEYKVRFGYCNNTIEEVKQEESFIFKQAKLKLVSVDIKYFKLIGSNYYV